MSVVAMLPRFKATPHTERVHKPVTAPRTGTGDDRLIRSLACFLMALVINCLSHANHPASCVVFLHHFFHSNALSFPALPLPYSQNVHALVKRVRKLLIHRCRYRGMLGRRRMRGGERMQVGRGCASNSVLSIPSALLVERFGACILLERRESKELSRVLSPLVTMMRRSRSSV